MTINAYLIYWCSEGLESVIPITQYERIDQDNIFRLLKEEPAVENPLGQIISILKMRARVNSQRHYELYAIDCDKDIGERELRSMFDNDPQRSANLIRKRGVEIFSDRTTSNKVKIV